MNYKELKTWAQEYNSQLLCTDKRFKNCVQVKSNRDMTNLFYDNAFVIEKYDFYIVFTEHHCYHLFHKDDYVVIMYSNVNNINMG